MTRGQRRGLIWSLVAIILVAIAPVAITFLAVWLADANGCTVSALGPEPCLIGGTDWGGFLAAAFVIHWMGLVTLPLGTFAILVWAVVALVLWRRSASRAS